MPEEILSALARDTSVVDGMNRTMMVAAETACAAARPVLSPLVHSA